MKLMNALLALASISFFFAAPLLAQERGSSFPRMSPNASVSQTIGLTDVKVTYGRPSVNGRTIFGGLEPYGSVWRTGANEATTITFTTAVKVQGKHLEAGTYSLFTIPGLTTWTVVFNSTAKQWGAFSYDSTKDLLRVPVKPILDDHQEQLLITFDDVSHAGAAMILRWHRTRIRLDLQVNTDSVFRAKAASELTNSTDPKKYLSFAFSALTNNLLIDEAVGWAEKSAQLMENYGSVALHARLLGQAGRFKEAAKRAEFALTLDQTGKFEPPPLRPLPEMIAEWNRQAK